MSFSISSAANWLPGIGVNAANKLINKGVTVFEDLKRINPEDLSSQVNIPINILNCAKNIATNVDAGYLQTLSKRSLELSSKVAGIGLELGVALLAQGISRLEDIKPSTLPDFSRLPSGLNLDYWNKIIFSVQLDLIPGLTKKHAWNIAYKSVGGAITSLQSFSSSFNGAIQGVSSDMVTKWKFLAGNLVEKGILDFAIAGNLRLARLIDGIGPQIAAALACINITEPIDLLKSSFNTISGYLPWITKGVFMGWIVQAFKNYVESLVIPSNPAECQIMLKDFVGICETIVGNAQELTANNLNLIVEKANSIKAGLINKILTSSQFISTKFPQDTGTHLQEIYDFVFGGIQNNGRSFINNMLNNIKTVIIHPENRLQLFDDLGLNQVISGYSGPNVQIKGSQKAVNPLAIDFGTIREEDSETRDFNIVSYSDYLRNILLGWSGDFGSWLRVTPLEPNDLPPSSSHNIVARLTIPDDISWNYRGDKQWTINVKYDEGGQEKQFTVYADAFVTYSIKNWVGYSLILIGCVIIVAALAWIEIPVAVILFCVGLIVGGLYKLFNWD